MRTVVVIANIFVLLLFSSTRVGAISASPFPVELRQLDGSAVILTPRGDEWYHWFEDADGYAVVRDGGSFVYATVDKGGDLVPTALQVGKAEPRAERLKKGLSPSPAAIKRRKLKFASPALTQWVGGATRITSQNSAAAAPGLQANPTVGRVKNLVVLCKFNDHVDGLHTRPAADYDIVFNHAGPHPTLAPTGSVKDFYKENSYGTFSVDSTVLTWVTLPQTEAYYCNNNFGFGSYPQNVQGMVEDALNLADQLVNFAEFDENNDGLIDAITIIHSGYGAEWDENPNHIWSHRWDLSHLPNQRWTSADLNTNGANVEVFAYHTEPALWAISGTEITRIGVIAHELGHFFGLPDLYDTTGTGFGAGSFCVMANSWGRDNSQRYPPHFCAWSKMELGWVYPTVVGAGSYAAATVQTNAQVYKITHGYGDGEYLLIENRQPFGFESIMPQGGLCIWHIDDGKDNNDEGGYPDQSGWPANNKHYKVALLQADGEFDLERRANPGDNGDIFHAAGVSAITPATLPNTDAYANGLVTPTIVAISSISASGPLMTFAVSTNPPPVSVNFSAGNFQLKWPMSGAGYILEDSTDLVTWNISSESVVVMNGEYVASPPASGQQLFYRLRAPIVE